MRYRLYYFVLVFIVAQVLPHVVCAQDSVKMVPNGTDGLQLTARDAAAASKVKELPPNEFEGSYSSFRIGLGLIYDWTAYSQSDVFKQQMDSAGFDLQPAGKLRDFRILGSGHLKTKRSISWKFAYMWDGNNQSWLVRESGITIGVPELAGHIFIGRTKEGFSMIKVMNGHSPWGYERQMALDVIPILADGIKWFGYLPKSRIFWNLGYFNDFISEGQSFSTFASQFSARVGWLPFHDKTNGKLLHVAGNFRYGKPYNGKIALKSRPESNPTPQLLNTGEFATDRSTHLGTEIYYGNNRVVIGSELLMHKFYASESIDHTFYGGNVWISCFFTKTRRPYNTVGSIFGFAQVRKSVFKGGWGEFEGLLHLSTLNLNDGDIKGGQFWRITPMINWYLTKVIRWEFIYGYGVYDRFNLKGNVHFFESRLQFTLM